MIKNIFKTVIKSESKLMWVRHWLPQFYFFCRVPQT